MEKILFVDDEPNILDTFRRAFHKRYELETASGSLVALDLLQSHGPFAVVVSDLKMPGMDGIELLSKIHIARPTTVRIMLTGHADLEAAIAAVNEGNVFRFLTKPCPAESMAKAVDAGIEQYRLVMAERELLRGTLLGSVAMLTDLLAMANPEAFGRSGRIKRHMFHLARKLEVKNVWRYEAAAMLSQVGCITIPEPILRKRYRGAALTFEEQMVMDQHTAISSALLSNIPRLESVREIIVRQNDPFDRESPPPLGSRMLKVILDYDDLEQQGLDKVEAVGEMQLREGMYDPVVLELFSQYLFGGERCIPRQLRLEEMRPGMILGQEVKAPSGLMLMAKGQYLNEPAIKRLASFTRSHGVQEPILVLIPVDGTGTC